MKNLLVIVSDRLTDLIRKGEITARYYNPAEFFDDVHILLINDDNPEISAIQKTVGNARLHVHNLPVPSFKSTLGWQPSLLNGWISAGVKLAQTIKPDLIRTYGIFHNGFLAARIKKALDIPLVVSLHTHPDFDMRRTVPLREIKKRITYECYRHLERESLCSADRVIRRALGPAADHVCVSASKSMLGHMINAAGSVELAITALAMRDGFAPPTLNLTDPDPECSFDCLPLVGRRNRFQHALKLSVAFGGHLVAIALSRWNHPSSGFGYPSEVEARVA